MQKAVYTVLALALLLGQPAGAQAADSTAAQPAAEAAGTASTAADTADKTAAPTYSTGSSDRMFIRHISPSTTQQDQSARTKSDEKARDDKPAKAKKAKKAKSAPDRFVEILQADGFTYYMDSRDARWIPMPHSAGEQIIDVWIKLAQQAPVRPSADGQSTATEPADPSAGQDAAATSATSPRTYYLEHYYMRPDTQQIQFLCELEVTGRPDNAVSERAYNPQNWENLVPGSLEDDLYHAVVTRMGKKKLSKKSDAPRSIHDMLDEYLRIAI